jgi:hypothetical protein
MNQRERHYQELTNLGAGPTAIRGEAAYRVLVLLEKKAHRFAERVCNDDVPEAEQDKHEHYVTESVKQVFGGELPPGFFINGDPRGYALKIDQPGDANPGEYLISYRDWGGYGILAPEFDE